jgi:dienelactone hydrolase
MHPYAVCATDDSPEPKPLILEVSPKALGNLDKSVATTEQIARWALKHGRRCVALRPTGRGNGSVYQNYGEVDLFEAIDHVKANYAIDTDRITITGASMGGAATWYLISHYPDVFAAAAPFCGYCDYRLWEKPGGLTFHMHEWEEPSWISRSAVFLVDNLGYTPVWILHGQWDRAVGGGVPVEHSRRMAGLLAERGFDHRYTEVPGAGHSFRTPELFERVVPWLLEQRKTRQLDSITHTAYTLRHNRSHWVAIEQLEEYGVKGTLKASILEDVIRVSTENVCAFSLTPPDVAGPCPVEIDGDLLEGVHWGGEQGFHRGTEGQWQQGLPDLGGVKHHRASGPIGDLFFDGTILVPGTCGSAYETHITREMARGAVKYYAQRNGGVHRGGIMGDNEVQLPVVEDAVLSEAQLKQHNLILYGTPSSNSVLARWREDLPISFKGHTVRVSDRTYTAEGCGVFALFPHPENLQRSVAVHGGTSPDAICWGSHLDMHLLPDYIVYAGGNLIDWGFWNNEWRSSQG